MVVVVLKCTREPRQILWTPVDSLNYSYNRCSNKCSLVRYLLKSSSVFSHGSSYITLSMKSHSLDVSFTNCARPGASGFSSTQMWTQLLDFSFSVAKASSAASFVMPSGGLWEWEFEWFVEVDLSMLTSGSPGQKEIRLTPAGEEETASSTFVSGYC